MDNEQQPPKAGGPQGYPPPPPPYPPPPYYYPVPAPAPQVPEEKPLPFKVKVGIGVFLVLIILFGALRSCSATPTKTTTKATPVMPPDPQAINNEYNSALAESAAAKAASDEAKHRAELTPGAIPSQQVKGTAPGQTTGSAPQETPDQQFWHQVKLEKWRREVDAPFVSGVGFVTKRPTSNDNAKVQGWTSETNKEPDQGLYEQAKQAVNTFDQHNTQEPALVSGTGATSPKPQPEPDACPTGFSFNAAEGPLHRLLEGTILQGVLTNRLDGEMSGPVIVSLTQDVWDQAGLHILFPAGTTALGISQQVSNGNQRRLAVAFHRIITKPDGYSVSLNKFHGLNQLGTEGLVSKVNSHYASIFGASLAVGAISGLSQLGSNGVTYSVAGGLRTGISQQGAESSMHILDRFLNRFPTITVKEGSRVGIYLTNDLPCIPEYANHRVDPNL